MVTFRCPQCNEENDTKNKFCINCGSPFHNLSTVKNSSSSINSTTDSIRRQEEAGNYQPSRTIRHLKYDQWEDQNLLTTTVKFYINTERVGPSVLMTDDAPNPLIFAIISSIIGGIISLIILTKMFSSLEGLPPTKPSAFEFPYYLCVYYTIGPIFGYYVGSALVSSILRGDFHVASEQHAKGDQIFRRLWGYLLLIQMIGALFLLPLSLNVEPIVGEYSNSREIYSKAELPRSFFASAAQIGLFVDIITMAIFIRVISTLEYDGKGIFFIVVIWLVVIILNYNAYLNFNRS